jgi:hypothetical protein
VCSRREEQQWFVTRADSLRPVHGQARPFVRGCRKRRLSGYPKRRHHRAAAFASVLSFELAAVGPSEPLSGNDGGCTAAIHSPVPARCWHWCPSARVQRQCRISRGRVWSVHANSHLRCPVTVPRSGSPTAMCPSGSGPELLFSDRRRQNFDGPSMSASPLPGRQTTCARETRVGQSTSAMNTGTANLT